MDKHKSNALEGKCLCDGCSHKFECFTQERIFSDPIFQGLFEALMAQGSSKDDAVKRVIGELEARIRLLGINTWTVGSPNAVGGYTTGTYWTGNSAGNVTLTNHNSSTTVTYRMIDGEEISWNACSDGIYQSR